MNYMINNFYKIRKKNFINISEKLKKFYKKIKFQSNIIFFFIFKIKK